MSKCACVMAPRVVRHKRPFIDMLPLRVCAPSLPLSTALERQVDCIDSPLFQTPCPSNRPRRPRSPSRRTQRSFAHPRPPRGLLWPFDPTERWHPRSTSTRTYGIWRRQRGGEEKAQCHYTRRHSQAYDVEFGCQLVQGSQSDGSRHSATGRGWSVEMVWAGSCGLVVSVMLSSSALR